MNNNGYVIILDRLELSGKAIEHIVSQCVKTKKILHVNSISQVRPILITALKEKSEVFIIMELATDEDTLKNSYQFLNEISALRYATGRYGVMVYTALQDPVILNAIFKLRPDSIVLRKESLSVLREFMTNLSLSKTKMRLSPEVAAIKSSDYKINLKELEGILAQASGDTLTSAAMRSQSNYKSLSHHRQIFAKRTGIKNTLEINRWLGKIQCSLGNYVGC
jgi:DNA-binding NarL/FixJ family response regulator